jgi:two-component system response regulator (stage 0 sporulation protein A)
MLTSWRLYIASPGAERLERAISNDSRFLVIGAGPGKQAVSEAARLCPDVLILDAVLAGIDGLKVLFMLSRLPAPPRVVYLARVAFTDPEPAPDAICPYPCEDAVLLNALSDAVSRPLPALARSREEQRLAMAGRLLDRLAVPPRLKGREYMRVAAAALACSPALGASYRERLYPYVAERCGTTPRAVERAVRTAVESAWLHGSLEGIQALFGLSVDAEKGKPTNAEFLSMLAQHIRDEKKYDGEH